MRMLQCAIVAIAFVAVTTGGGAAQSDGRFDDWPILKSTYPSTGGDGTLIKGYDPVISGAKCYTTFMAVPPGENPPVYPAFNEFDAVAAGEGTLCTNGRWRMMDGSKRGTTPFRVFFKNGTFYGR